MPRLMKDGRTIDSAQQLPVSRGGDGEVISTLQGQPQLRPAQQQQENRGRQKQNQKIKGLNATLKQAKELEGAGNYDQAITILQQATQVDPNSGSGVGLSGRCAARRQEIHRRH